MQNNSISQKIVNIVLYHINYNRGAGTLMDLYLSVLYILYGIHKGYPVVYDEDDLFFDVDDTFDHLLTDIREYYGERFYYCKRRNLYNGLIEIDHDSFEQCYRDVLCELNHRLSVSIGKKDGDFLTPEALNSLISYYVNREGCEFVYDPFCGTASILYHLTNNYENLIFHGQDIFPFATLLARVNYEACYGYDSHIDCKDSVKDWSPNYYDAVVSCPPLGVKFSGAEKDSLYDEFHINVKSLEDLFFLRALDRNNPMLMVCLTSLGFSYRDGEKYIRKELVERNLLDTIVSLPSNLLYGTSIPCLLFVCKKYREKNDPIKFIHAEEFIVGNTKLDRTFDMRRFASVVESESSEYCVCTNIGEIRSFDYNLNPALYISRNFQLSEGQSVFSLDSLLSLEEGIRVEGVKGGNIIIPSKMKTNFIQILLNRNVVDKIARDQDGYRHRLYEPQRGKTLLLVSEIGGGRRYALYDDDSAPFYTAPQVNVFSVNEEYVTPEYLLYLLTNHPSLTSSKMSILSFAKFPFVIDDKKHQMQMVDNLLKQHADKEKAEHEANERRLGVKRNISDLEHMLGSTQMKLNNIIDRLSRVSPNNEKYPEMIKQLKDNMEYMNRVIHYNNASIEEETLNIKEHDFWGYIDNYLSAWSNYGGNYFNFVIENYITSRFDISFDKDLFTVMLDSVLNNAIRHGFHKRKDYTSDNKVNFAFLLEKYKNEPYLVIRIANNGDPMSDDFTIEDYIARGRYTATTGRSGLGGYHVYQVVKGHKGYLALDSNKVWNVIVDILIPVNNVEYDNLSEYEHECI